jgi:hypothetical protein
MRARLETVKLTGRVQNGRVDVDLPEGTPVTIVVDDKDYSPVPVVYLDASGNESTTPEHEAELAATEAELDRGEGIPWDVVRAELQDIRSRTK